MITLSFCLSCYLSGSRPEESEYSVTGDSLKKSVMSLCPSWGQEVGS